MNSRQIDQTSSVDDGQVDADALFALRLVEDEARASKECTSDAALASILQKQFDMEFNSELSKEEARLNGHSKVGISLNKFRRSASYAASSTIDAQHDSFYDTDDASDRDKSEPDTHDAWDVFEQSELKQRSRMMGRSGFVLDEHGNMITKHDIPTTSRKNMCRLMELKTDIQTGDAAAKKDDFKITNYVYNKLKVHSKKNSRRESQRSFDRRERENVCTPEEIQSFRLSDATRNIMDGLLVAYKIEKLNGVIGHGKESTVLHATGRDHEDTPGQEVAIKVFKSASTMAFKTRDSYNKSKFPSYKFDKPKSKNDSLNKWAERGFKNLRLLRRASINCPEAISLRKHVLVMSFLGKDACPSPKLKDVKLNEVNLKSSYDQVIDIMKRMYKECDLIHGDLSEYNLLWHNDQVYVIDVSQSMFSSHPNANAFLYRDCKNISDFYRKSGLLDVAEDKELFTMVCGKDLSDKDVELWSKIEDFPCNEKLMQRDQNADLKYGVTDCLAQIFNSTERKLVNSDDTIVRE